MAIMHPFWPDSARLCNGTSQTLTSGQLQDRIETLADDLSAHNDGRVLALAGDNSPDWIVADLAAARAKRAIVPIPGFFTKAQIAHVCSEAGIAEVILNGQRLPVAAVWPGIDGTERRSSPQQVPDVRPGSSLPQATHKVTFTSGTTGNPKGICLTWEQQMQTARSLVEALGPLKIRVHLNVLPLAVLLENIAGVIAPLMMGAAVVTPGLSDVGLRGSSDFDAVTCIRAIEKHKAESIILLPQMLHAMVAHASGNAGLRSALSTLKFIAVGGAPTPAAVLDAARSMGLPVYEGYGLTECASVVCLNTPGADLAGTVGTPLPGLTVGLTDDREVWVEGRSHAGILGVAQPVRDAEGGHMQRILTGDIGEWVEKNGKRFLRIVGRRKNILITSFGRNVSPEWPERLLMDTGLFRQAVVICEGQPFLQAILVPLDSTAVTRDKVAHTMSHINEALPDYARIGCWTISQEPFSDGNGLATPNGRPLRNRIAQRFADPVLT